MVALEDLVHAKEAAAKERRQKATVTTHIPEGSLWPDDADDLWKGEVRIMILM